MYKAKGKKKSFVLLLVLIGFVLIVFADVAFSDVKTDQDAIKTMKVPYEAKIKHWESMAAICIAVTIAIGILGVLAGTLQKSNRELLKNLALGMGVVIGVMTAINLGLSKADYQDYAVRARRLITTINVEIIRVYPEGNEQARQGWIAKILALFQELDNIGAPGPAKLNAQKTSGFTLFPYLYALEAQSRNIEIPGWLTSLPADADNLYFVGMGENANLEKAKALSYSEAKCEAGIVLYLQFERATAGRGKTFDSRSLAFSMLKSAEIEDTYFQFFNETQRFRFYTLLKLNKRRMLVDKRFYPIDNRTYVPASLSDYPEKLQGLSKDDFRRSLIRQEYLMNTIHKDLSPDELESFWKIHQTRLDGEYKVAFSKINPLLARKPGFYFGWFEQATDLEAEGDRVGAGNAYLRALELERALPFRDIRLVFAYADFLQKQKRHQEAIDIVAKAIQNDPNSGLLQIKFESLEKIKE